MKISTGLDNPRRMLYEVLVLLWLFSLLFFISSEVEVSQSILIEATVLLITVFIIDGLIRYDRNHKLLRVNKHTNELVKFQASFAISRLAHEIGIKVTLDNPSLPLSSKNANDFVNNVLNSSEFTDFSAKLNERKASMVKRREILNKTIKENQEAVIKLLENLYPKPNPEATALFERQNENVLTGLSVGEDVARILLIKLPAEMKKHGYKRNDYEIVYELTWDDTFINSPHTISVAEAMRIIFEDYIELIRMAESNNLYFDV